MRRRRLWIGLAVVGLLGMVGLWMVGTATEPVTGPPIKLLAGQTAESIQPPKPNGFSREVYYIRANYTQAVTDARSELGGWDENPNTGGGIRWQEMPTSFERHARQVVLRPNRIEPDSLRVLGPVSDSRVWVTVIVYGGIRESNIVAGLGRFFTGNRNR